MENRQENRFNFMATLLFVVFALFFLSSNSDKSYNKTNELVKVETFIALISDAGNATIVNTPENKSPQESSLDIRINAQLDLFISVNKISYQNNSINRAQFIQKQIVQSIAHRKQFRLCYMLYHSDNTEDPLLS